MKTVTAAILVIGDEVLSGRTQDANTQVLAKALGVIGVQLREARAIADDEDTIIEGLNAMRARFDYVFTSGGIGPTHDDITAEAVGKAFGARVTIRDDARALLDDYYGDRINEGRLRMARIPDGASLIDNPVSIAPGFRLENVFVMAGVPSVFKAMLGSVLGQLSGGAVIHEISIASPKPEGELSGPLGAVAAKHSAVSIGSYPRIKPEGGFEVTVVARSADADALAAAEADLKAMFAGF
jgi:molybdenum cofactor synthesis domain-containing protein